ncbi:MAG: CARDB domain-containing protein [Methanomassiliicoccales archaeon]
MMPRLASFSTLNVTIVWTTVVPPIGGNAAHTDIWTRSSIDGGVTWDAANRINGTGTPGVSANSPDIACNSTGAVFVVWSDNRTGIFRIYYSISRDQGSHFSTPELVTLTAAGNQTNPSIAISKDAIYVAWAEYIPRKDPDLFLARSFDSGATFQTPIRVDTTGSAFAIQGYPSVCARGNDVFVAWHDTRTDPMFDIYGAFSDNQAASFIREMKVSDGAPGTAQTMPSAVFTANGRIVVAWQDSSDENNCDIRVAYSDDDGVTFTHSIKASDDLGQGKRVEPRLASDYRGITYLVYSDDRGGQQPKVMFASSTNLSSFSTSVRVDLAAPAVKNVKQEYPTVACASNGTILIAYDQSGINKDIFFTRMIVPNVPPLVSVYAPVDGSTVPTGEFRVNGTASDPDAYDPIHPSPFSMQYMLLNGSNVEVDWTDINISAMPEWNFTLNSSHYANGNYSILVRAFDSISYSDTATIDIVIANAAPDVVDLEISNDDISFDRFAPRVGDLVNISAVVSNLGNAPASFVSTRFSVDSSEIGQVNLTLVPPGEYRIAKMPWIAVLGTHNVSVMVDANASIIETNESNNLAWKDIVVEAQPVLAPDLVVLASNITFEPSTIYEGADVNVSLVVYNGGNGPAPNALFSFDLDGTYANQTVTVPAGTALTVYTIWPSVSAGFHSVTITADPMHLLGETNYSNNEASASFTALPDVLNRPDLLPNSGIQLTPGPPSLTEGNQTLINVTVLNDGNSPATNIDVRFQIDSVTIGIRRIAALAPGSAEEVGVQWLATAGSHTVSVQVDYANNITEINKLNNNASRGFSVRQRAYYVPDLALQSGAISLSPAQPKVDVPCWINVTVVNLGNDSVSSAAVVITMDGNQLGSTLYVTHLDPGASQTVGVQWMPSYGQHTIAASVDPSNLIHESNKTNNNATMRLDLGAAPTNLGDITLPILGILSIVVLSAGMISYSRSRKRKKR